MSLFSPQFSGRKNIVQFAAAALYSAPRLCLTVFMTELKTHVGWIM